MLNPRISYSTSLLNQGISNYLDGNPTPVEPTQDVHRVTPAGVDETSFHLAAGIGAVHRSVTTFLETDGSVAPNLPTEEKTLKKWLDASHDALRTRLGIYGE